jgi:hypothetical protein
VQAADFIGQMGDPLYPRKANALFFEFEEVGVNRQLGYSSPADLIENIRASTGTASRSISRLEAAMHNLTVTGRQWSANLHNLVMCAEHAFR